MLRALYLLLMSQLMRIGSQHQATLHRKLTSPSVRIMPLKAAWYSASAGQHPLNFEEASLLRKCFARHLQLRILHQKGQGIDHLGVHHLAYHDQSSCNSTQSLLEALRRDPHALGTHLTGPVPSPRPAAGSKCNVMGSITCYEFRDRRVTQFFRQTFMNIIASTASHPALPNVTLSRHDLFHAHLFITQTGNQRMVVGSYQHRQGQGQGQDAQQGNAATSEGGHQDRHHAHSHPLSFRPSGPCTVNETSLQVDNSSFAPGSIGLLFHASEYPAQDAAQGFDIYLGHCQTESTLPYDQRVMRYRNYLWLQGGLYALDASPQSTVGASLLWPETAELRTLYEEDWGMPLADVYCMRMQDIDPAQHGLYARQLSDSRQGPWHEGQDAKHAEECVVLVIPRLEI